MSSAFFGLTIAQTGLNAFQASINTTANNISNVQTDGYSKQVVNLKTSAGIRSYEKYGTMGTGVTAESVTQLRDQYYDEKYWNNSSRYGEYDKKLYYMNQIEDYYKDSTAVNGFSSIYSKMFNALNSLKSDAGNTSVRNEFISDSQELMTYFNSVGTQMQELQSTVNDEVKSTVDNVNSIAEKIAAIDKQVNVIEMQGGHANDLRDQRAKLVDELSAIVPVEVSENKVTNSNYPDMETGATYYSVKVNGNLLVDNYNYNTLSTKTRTEKDNQSDIDGLYDVVWTSSGSELNINGATMRGSLKALFDIRDGNNSENMTGTITGTTSTSITLSNPSITDINALNMPDEGTITIDSVEYAYNGFSVTTDKDGAVNGVTFNLKNPISTDKQGEMTGYGLVTGTDVSYKGIPYYQNQMNSFLRSFCGKFNAIEETGYDYNGNKMGAFFVANDTDATEKTMTASTKNATFTNTDNTCYRMTALNAAVAKASQKNPEIFATTAKESAGTAAYDLLSSSGENNDLLDLQSQTTIYRGTGGNSFLECVYADITVDTQECTTFDTNYKAISKSIEEQRTSVSGVDEDEEALDLIKFQNAYNLSSKCVSVLAEIYDRLITQTGV